MRRLKVDDLKDTPTISVEEAAWVMGISRSHAYVIAKRGEVFETIRIGSRIRIVAQPLYRLLTGQAADTQQAVTS
jgi:hypothetical protein